MVDRLARPRSYLDRGFQHPDGTCEAIGQTWIYVVAIDRARLDTIDTIVLPAGPCDRPGSTILDVVGLASEPGHTAGDDGSRRGSDAFAGRAVPRRHVRARCG